MVGGRPANLQKNHSSPDIPDNILTFRSNEFAIAIASTGDLLSDRTLLGSLSLRNIFVQHVLISQSWALWYQLQEYRLECLTSPRERLPFPVACRVRCRPLVRRGPLEATRFPVWSSVPIRRTHFAAAAGGQSA